MENTFELVFVPAPGFSQFAAEMDLAHRLAAHDPRITVTVFIADIPISDHSLASYFKSINADESPRVSIVRLPPPQIECPKTGDFLRLFAAHMEAYKSIVKEIVLDRTNGRRLAGFVLDMFCSTMLDVADELGVPSYFFFASGASMLSFMFHFEGPLAGQIPATPELEIPGFKTPLPETAWPAVIKNPNSAAIFLRNTRQMLRSKGVLPNTFMELETDLIRSLSEKSNVPQIYPIGPIVHVDGSDKSTIKKSLNRLLPEKNHVDESVSSTEKEGISYPLLEWLSQQPPQSVVFLCFGTRGAFGEDQVREIAAGLENSGQRFVWSLRRRPESGKGNDYSDFKEVLPEGFLDRTREIGRVVGWAPQREVLSHPSTGAFVSHCGWNSLLESMWLGVPVAAWPLFAEQQLNAYHWTRELGLATEMRIDYSYDPSRGQANVLVEAAEVEAGIRRVMEGEEGVAVRKKLEEMSLTAKTALLDGGSSHRALTRFVDDVIGNVSTST